MSDMLVVLCSCPDEAVAATLARGLVSQKLAACVNILPGARSIYRWQDRICDEAEVLLVIKSLAPRFEALQSWLLAHHPYDIPEVVALPVDRVSDDYRAWLESSLGSEVFSPRD